jgi:hypothetical protein
VTRRIRCFLVISILLCACAAWTQEKDKFLADRHKDRGVKCEICHGEANPPTAASGEKCLTCHKSIEAVAEKTQDFEKNPHKNHITEAAEVECTQCHNGHKADDPLCNRCHSGFKFEKKKA